MKKTPIEVFSDWAESGKDLGMQKGHKKSVEHMLHFATKDLDNFSFIDAGCGNGWVVRDVSNSAKCTDATGVDGSLNMISKAKSLDRSNNYICADLLNWIPDQKVDLVHSMEVFYYFENPKSLINHIYTNWLKENSRLIIGIDYYFENSVTHSWPEETGISIMKLFSESQWTQFFKQVGFKNINSWRFGQSKNWSGTLIITGIK